MNEQFTAVRLAEDSNIDMPTCKFYVEPACRRPGAWVIVEYGHPNYAVCFKHLSEAMRDTARRIEMENLNGKRRKR